jgi:hypothetical protein
MELVYPIYLDVPMMTAFLGSLEGGIIEEADVEGKSTDAGEKIQQASIKAKLSGLISTFVSTEGGVDLSKKLAESVESQYKSKVRISHAALFIRLRDLLVEQKQVKIIESSGCLQDISIGDIVEFQGLAVANPSYQIRSSFNQLLPILTPFVTLMDSNMEQQLIQLKEAKPKKPIIMDKQSYTFEDQRQINDMRDSIKVQQQQTKNLVSMFKTLNEILAGLFPEDKMDKVLIKNINFSVISHVYPAFVRNERIQDLYGGNWHCIGKVIGILDESDEYDLLKDAPISYFAKDQFTTFAGLLNNENLSISVTDSKVKAPAIIVAPLAIFA